jgi:general secretion pathway protein J
MMFAPRRRRAARGFTLIEVMVSLLILAVMSAMSWKGMDSIMRSREIAESSVRRTLRLQSVMKQWQADLNTVVDVQVVPALQFDGNTLRMTRRTQGGVQVVAWALRQGRWVRFRGESPARWQRSRALSNGRCSSTARGPGQGRKTVQASPGG